LTTPHYPLDGLYDSLSEEAIRRQLEEMKLGGMGGLHTYNPVGILTSGKGLAEVYRRAAEACRGRSKGERPGRPLRCHRLSGLRRPQDPQSGPIFAQGDGATYRETWRAALAWQARLDLDLHLQRMVRGHRDRALEGIRAGLSFRDEAISHL